MEIVRGRNIYPGCDNGLQHSPSQGVMLCAEYHATQYLNTHQHTICTTQTSAGKCESYKTVYTKGTIYQWPQKLERKTRNNHNTNPSTLLDTKRYQAHTTQDVRLDKEKGYQMRLLYPQLLLGAKLLPDGASITAPHLPQWALGFWHMEMPLSKCRRWRVLFGGRQVGSSVCQCTVHLSETQAHVWHSAQHIATASTPADTDRALWVLFGRNGKPGNRINCFYHYFVNNLLM